MTEKPFLEKAREMAEVVGFTLANTVFKGV
jgi:hypothetical protein